MKITDILKPVSIQLNVAPPKSKVEAINILADLMEKGGNLSNKEEYVKAVIAREDSGSTGLGDGIATPHAKSSAVREAGLAAMVVPQGMDFAALDGNPSRLFFMIAAPNSASDLHVQLLSKLATMLMDPDFKDALINAKSVDEFLQLINEKEEGKSSAEEAPAEAEKTPDGYEVLAVTACPTGIAHTYMAAESLEQHAKRKNISIKVETNGTGGRKNVLTDEEIAKAKCIIVAADKNVPMARFNGKHVIITKVANGINKADELLDKAMAQDAPIYHHSGNDEEASGSVEGESIGRQIYKHLMNGVSHMLPFVVGGGILIAIAFLVDVYDPANPSNFGSNTPLAAFFKNVGGVSFGFMLPVLAGFIGMSIADRPGLVAGFVGGALANSGGSGFLGALIAGFAAGYIILGLRKALNFLPASLDGIKNILLYPLLGVFLMGIAITFIINPPVSAINTWLVETLKGMDPSSRILIGIVVGGMMSIDMGGPFNKAAYVTGTALLADGEFGVMASVMAGGMVPPIAIALCTTFFGNRFTEAERKSGPTNYIMGLSFITEGAIPFAAADPARVIPSCIVGSAVAGALSMAFECTLRAPHGGIFVVPTIGNPLMYLVAIAAGAVVSMILLAILKKPLNKKQ
ncbi:PTS fructose transporter subunit IIABC [Megamonas hypermegale]|nr:fructose-specific PTS transporter subunit EIIC [Megamonas hypermegale]MDM8143781.1 fructose-specific PTS transporter subunit EIIC [Megamonas hypermegale]